MDQRYDSDDYESKVLLEEEETRGGQLSDETGSEVNVSEHANGDTEPVTNESGTKAVDNQDINTTRDEELKNNNDNTNGEVENNNENTNDEVENNNNNTNNEVENNNDNTNDEVENNNDNTNDEGENNNDNTNDDVENIKQNTNEEIEKNDENTNDEGENNNDNTNDEGENNNDKTNDDVENIKQNTNEEIEKNDEKNSDELDNNHKSTNEVIEKNNDDTNEEMGKNGEDSNEMVESTNENTNEDTVNQPITEYVNEEQPKSECDTDITVGDKHTNCNNSVGVVDEDSEQTVPASLEGAPEDQADSNDADNIDNVNDERVIEDHDGEVTMNDIDPDTTLANQQSENEAMHGLIDSNVILEKNAEDMKVKVNEIEDKYEVLEKTVDELKTKNNDQENLIHQLNERIATAKVGEESQKALAASHRKVGDLENQLKRLTMDDHEKSQTIRSLEMRLETKMEILPPPKSKTCTIL